MNGAVMGFFQGDEHTALIDESTLEASYDGVDDVNFWAFTNDFFNLSEDLICKRERGTHGGLEADHESALILWRHEFFLDALEEE